MFPNSCDVSRETPVYKKKRRSHTLSGCAKVTGVRRAGPHRGILSGRGMEKDVALFWNMSKVVGNPTSETSGMVGPLVIQRVRFWFVVVRRSNEQVR